MWDITRLMSRNVTSDLDRGVRRPQRLVDFKDLKSFLFMPLSSSLLPHPAQLAPGRKHQQEENPQLVHNKQRIWASRLWGWFLMGDQIVRKFKTFFSGRREESSDPCCEDKFANVIYTIRLWRWPTRKNILEIFLQMSEMRLNEIMASTSRRPTFYMINYILPAILINVSILKQQTNVRGWFQVISSTLLCPISLSSLTSKYQYRDHLVGY